MFGKKWKKKFENLEHKYQLLYSEMIQQRDTMEWAKIITGKNAGDIEFLLFYNIYPDGVYCYKGDPLNRLFITYAPKDQENLLYQVDIPGEIYWAREDGNKQIKVNDITVEMIPRKKEAIVTIPHINGQKTIVYLEEEEIKKVEYINIT